MTISTEELFLERERGRENREGECSVKWGLRGAGALYNSLSREVGASVPSSQLPAPGGEAPGPESVRYDQPRHDADGCRMCASEPASTLA